MAAIASLRYFCSFGLPLHKIASFQQAPASCFSTNTRTYFAVFLEVFFLIVINVRRLAFGEPVYEECLGSEPERDDVDFPALVWRSAVW